MDQRIVLEHCQVVRQTWWARINEVNACHRYSKRNNNIFCVISCLFALFLSHTAHTKNGNIPSVSSITVNGIEREFHLYVPPGIDKSKPIPLVFDLHGTGVGPDKEAELTQLASIAKNERFLVVWPRGEYPRRYSGKLSWNANLRDSKYDDLAFVRSLIAHIAEIYPVNSQMIYVTGFSGGARMASRIGCEMADLIAAIAPLGGLQYPMGCAATRPMPVITFHGENDREFSVSRIEIVSEIWAEHNKCKNVSTGADVTKSATLISYSDCENNADVVMYRIPDSGHTWPGSPRARDLEQKGLGKTNMEIAASELIWEFFKEHPMVE